MTEISNGDKAWNLLMDKIDGIQRDVRDIKKVLPQVTEHELLLRKLPCDAQSAELRMLRESVLSKLGTKAFFVQLIPALMAVIVLVIALVR